MPAAETEKLLSALQSNQAYVDAWRNPPEEIDMEETYFYRFNPPQGFGIQKVYTSDGRIDETYTVRNNDTVAIAEGYHPLCGAPGYEMYYLWTMAGRVNRGLISAKDPQHGWVK